MVPPPSLGRHADASARGLMRVAEYVRMSTDHQRYSTENQSAVIREYAVAHDMVIVRTYADEGKSGLDIGGRDALRRLLSDVQSGAAPFEAVLVYDISRWGRFQDADESAHYEYLCKKASIRVIYCAEQFTNDGTPVAAIIKSVKRAMAGEYSRELSAKVFRGQCHLVELGYHQGGRAGFGMRRLLIDDKHVRKGALEQGEYKSIQTDRVILTPGPAEEVDIVRRIYGDFVDGRMNEGAIAAKLNREGLLREEQRPWTRGTVHQVLISEKYVGHNVYNKVSCKLRQQRVCNPPSRWVRRDGAFEGIVTAELFETVRQIMLARSRRYSDEEMLALLRELCERSGTLSGLLIDEQENMPSSAAYGSRFGGLTRAYSLIGYTPSRDYRYLEINRHLRTWRPAVMNSVVEQLRRAHDVSVSIDTDLLTVNHEWTASVAIARCHVSESGSRRWRVRFDVELMPDVTIAVRMDAQNQFALDYYLMPRLDIALWPRRIGDENGALIDSYRFDSLEILEQMAARCALAKAA